MISIKSILQLIPHKEYIGVTDLLITHPVQASSGDFVENSFTWVSDKNISLLNDINIGLVICSSKASFFNKNCNYLIVENPRLAFRDIIATFFVRAIQPHISEKSSIASSVKLGKDITIEPNVVIEEGCEIGNNTIIGANTVIKSGTLIGNNVKIGSNCTIGGIGFGYEKDIEGNYMLMPHLGNVKIFDNVEIGNNTCIDKAVIGSTILNENVKVDNLVHIAHGVIIGKNSLIIANAMIGGSTIIGEDVWLAPSASVLNKKTIGNRSVIGLAAVVVKNVSDDEVIVGNPGKPLIKR